MSEAWLILALRDIYINSNLKPLKNSLEAREALSLNKQPSNDHKDHPNQHENSQKYVMTWGIPLWVWWKVNGNRDNNLIRISQWRESNCRKNTSVKKRNKSKRAGLWEWQSVIWVGKLTIWVWCFYEWERVLIYSDDALSFKCSILMVIWPGCVLPVNVYIIWGNTVILFFLIA